MNSHQLCISTLIGGVSRVFVSIFLGETIANFIANYKKPKETKPTRTKELLIKLWGNYGQFGVGFMGTLLVGAPVSIAVAVGFGAEVKRLLWHCLAAVVIRCVVFTYFFGFIKTLF